ncbi:MAG: hypothetical protein HY299_10830 [Verrucomicrobia bacterium]|nr:hypothetical protein [Verrucomicrobiota bacterium]
MGKLHKPALALLAVLLILASNGFQTALNTQRKNDERLGLGQSSGLENAPPLLAFTTVALGGFRGVIANALWIRATKLQDEGRFFEMAQLSDWITKLEPHFAAVWANRAWNMAYNISVRFSSPMDRWRWVKQGVELLRDEGLRYNPHDALIYRELGFTFQHKMGYFLDEAHQFYKAAWFAEMTTAMGGGATNLAELIQPVTDDARNRVKILKEHYKLDPALMGEVEAKYGKLEWRLPEPHAIYWGYVGLKNCPDNALNHDRLIDLRRLIYQCMAALVIRVKISNFTQDGYPVTSPRFDLIEVTHKAFEDLAREEKTAKGYSIMVAHRNFVREMIYQLYAANRIAEAERWFKLVRERYPDFTDGQTKMEPYALGRLQELIQDGNYQRTKSILLGFIQSQVYAEALDEEDNVLHYEYLAQTLYTRFMAKYGGTDRIKLQDFSDIQREVLCDLLNPETGLYPHLAARVMSRRKISSYTNLCAQTFTLPNTNSLERLTNRVNAVNPEGPGGAVIPRK